MVGDFLLTGAVYESYIRTAMLYGSEAWCLRESDMEISEKDREIQGESNVSSTP